MKEGSGRRTPARDIRRDAEEQTRETGSLALARKKRELVTTVLAVDGPEKALTGRKPEVYVIESGIPLDELFPKNGHILNIGDPWQTLDLPQVTSIDYESGEEAMFIVDPEEFLMGLEDRLNDLVRFFDDARLYDEGLEKEQNTFQTLIEHIHHASKADYPTCVTSLHHLLDRIGNRIKKDEISEVWRMRDLWFALHRLMRGLDDVHFLETVVEPELITEAVRRKGLSLEEQKTLKERIISRERFLKRTKYAEIKKATFPDVPYEDQAFDRLVASWSLSTHLFPVLDTAEFSLYWDEVSRLLTRDGVAYLWPVYGGNEHALAESLLEYQARGGDAAIFGRPNEWGESAWMWVENERFIDEIRDATLIIFPVGASSLSKQRVKNILEKNVQPITTSDLDPR